MQNRDTGERGATENRGTPVALLVVFLLLPVVTAAVWTAAREAGGISHAEITIVHSGNWEPGVYKRCTTINGNGAGAPDQPPTLRQTLLCDDAPAGDAGDGDAGNGNAANEKFSKVFFQGETFLLGRDLKEVLIWNCSTSSPDPNAPGKGAPISCERVR